MRLRGTNVAMWFGMLAPPRCRLALVLALGLFLAGLAPRAHASELSASGTARGLVIHDAEETLRDFCRLDGDGVLWLELPSGMRFELITSTDDPAILNPGDGAFHPFDRAEVTAALGALRYPLGRVRADVFILPFPRRGGLESAAGPQLVLLAPGGQPLAPEHQHAEFVHELGHVVQYQLMPDADAPTWERYRTLRGIGDRDRFCPSAPHADRPHEIFAEDFRALFGGTLATVSGGIENASLAQPLAIEGLSDFLQELAGAANAPLALVGNPTPSPGAVRFSRAGISDAPLDVYDVLGRHVASVPARALASQTEWRWDGRDASGRAVTAGTVYARVRESGGAATRVTLVR